MPQRPIRQEISQRKSPEAERTARGKRSRRDKASVQGFLDRFASALISGDTKAIAALWETPAFVIDSTMARVVSTNQEIELFFSGAKDAYNARGIVDTRAEVLDLDWISDDLVMVRVRWPYLDAANEEHGEESSTYTLKRDEKGELRLRVATMRGESSEPAAHARTRQN